MHSENISFKVYTPRYLLPLPQKEGTKLTQEILICAPPFSLPLCFGRERGPSKDLGFVFWEKCLIVN